MTCCQLYANLHPSHTLTATAQTGSKHCSPAAQSAGCRELTARIFPCNYLWSKRPASPKVPLLSCIQWLIQARVHFRRAIPDSELPIGSVKVSSVTVQQFDFSLSPVLFPPSPWNVMILRVFSNKPKLRSSFQGPLQGNLTEDTCGNED